MESEGDIDPTKNPKVSNSSVRNKNAQIVAKQIVQKYKKILQKMPPLPFDISDVADAETVNYNNDINISNISSNKSAQIAAKKIAQKCKTLAKKKAPIPFDINDVGDPETINHNNDTNISNVLSNKSAQIAAQKIVKKYRNLARKKTIPKPSKKPDDDLVFLKQVPVHPEIDYQEKQKMVLDL